MTNSNKKKMADKNKLEKRIKEFISNNFESIFNNYSCYIYHNSYNLYCAESDDLDDHYLDDHYLDDLSNDLLCFKRMENKSFSEPIDSKNLYDWNDNSNKPMTPIEEYEGNEVYFLREIIEFNRNPYARRREPPSAKKVQFFIILHHKKTGKLKGKGNGPYEVTSYYDTGKYLGEMEDNKLLITLNVGSYNDSPYKHIEINLDEILLDGVDE